MTEDTDSGEKPFAASQKKLDDARAKGEFARSADLTTAAAYCGLMLVTLAFGGAMIRSLGETLSFMLQQPHDLGRDVLSKGGGARGWGIVATAVAPIVPLFAVPACFALVTILAQRAFVVTPSKIAPKLNRISPLAGLKNKFGRAGLFEFAKSFAKLLIFMLVLGYLLMTQIDRIIATLHLPAALVIAELGRLTAVLMALVFTVALLLGALDLLWQMGEHARRHRMTRQEMLDEMKQSEGDPVFKQQRRMRGQEIAMNKMLSDVPRADVVIVNPTHYAVALQWDRAAGTAPTCVAKGVDEVATKIRALAQENSIPIHADPPTARAIHASTQIGQQISPEHYQPVAAAIRFAEAMRKQAGLR